MSAGVATAGAVSAEAAQAAFKRGDFAEARRLARAPAAPGADDAARTAAQVILRGTSLDPVIVWLSAGCVAFFALILALYH